MNFQIIKSAVAAQFERMQKHALFRVDVDKHVLWDTYLNSFPDGTNPIYRTRREYDCTCCKQFVRTVGDLVAIIDGKTVSIWDVTLKEPAFQAVVDRMSGLVKSKPIADAFLHYEAHAGTDQSLEDRLKTGGEVKRWDHFFVNIKRDFVTGKSGIPTRLGQLRTSKETLARALEEITDEALETVQELIANGSLYRGEEHKKTITEFHRIKQEYLRSFDKELFLWVTAKTAPGYVTGIRNSAIGTLLVDLSEGKDLEYAVKAFEVKVAPSNYKRPTALVTKGMIEKAKQTISDLGLSSALERRYAVLPDISINNVMFADRSSRKLMADVFDELAHETSSRVSQKSLDKIENVPIDKFVSDILPKINSMEVLLENHHTGNLVSLIAPGDPTAGKLFKWDNLFSWSYNGEMADSMKERVKKAGGNVTGDLCCRLAWNNTDDLDFHMVEPSGAHIYYGDRRSAAGGTLDVDANGMNGIRPNPVENIFYARRSHMKEGVYHLSVHQFSQRQREDVGFEAEIDFMGTVWRFAYPQVMTQGSRVTVATFRYTAAKGVEILESLPQSTLTRTAWGLPTQSFHKVNVMMLSPNFWDDKGVGNKHFFFMLEGCVNDGSARGFFNEFLDSRLDPHRKVFEMVGSKLKPAPAQDQLSGLGFSSTQRNTVTVRVKGTYSRTINLVF